MTHIERLQVTAELLVAVAQRLEVLVNLHHLPGLAQVDENNLDLLAEYLGSCRDNAAQCEVVPAGFIDLVEEAQSHCARATANRSPWPDDRMQRARLLLAAESAHRAAVVANRTVAASKAGRVA